MIGFSVNKFTPKSKLNSTFKIKGSTIPKGRKKKGLTGRKPEPH